MRVKVRVRVRVGFTAGVSVRVTSVWQYWKRLKGGTGQAYWVFLDKTTSVAIGQD